MYEDKSLIETITTILISITTVLCFFFNDYTSGVILAIFTILYILTGRIGRIY